MERKTRQHDAICDAIHGAGRPLLAREILAIAGHAVPQLSIATVYRNIKALLQAGRVRPVLFPGQNPRYEWDGHRPGHRHYFQCRGCERVFDLATCPGNLDALVPAGFVVEDHEILLFGRCRDCVVVRRKPRGR